MIRKFIFKKVTVFIASLSLTIIVFSCNGAKDDKNDVEPYPTTDTTQHMEHKNDDQKHDSTHNGSY